MQEESERIFTIIIQVRFFKTIPYATTKQKLQKIVYVKDMASANILWF